jgi:hypothetical protein
MSQKIPLLSCQKDWMTFVNFLLVELTGTCREEYCHVGCDTVQSGLKLPDVYEECTSSIFRVGEKLSKQQVSLRM